MSYLAETLRKVTRAARMARSGARIFRNAGLDETLNLNTLWAMGRVVREAGDGVRGMTMVARLHAFADPLRAALVCGEERLSFGELNERINQLTHGLHALGIGPGERIAAFLHNSNEYIELNAALQAVGGQNVQISYRLKAAEVAYILENSQARAMLFHGDLVGVVEEALKLAEGKGLPIARERCIAVGGAPGFAASTSSWRW